MEECSLDLIFLVGEGQLFFPMDETRFSKIK